MGQQQIFLLIVVFIVVTIAVIVALNLGGEVQVQFQEDQYTQIMLEQGEQFRATYEKPELFGGGAHDWGKVDFTNVPCNFGIPFSASGTVCKNEEGTLVVLASDHGNYLGLLGIAHIGGKDVHHQYSRELRVYADSIVFKTEWVAHQ